MQLIIEVLSVVCNICILSQQGLSISSLPYYGTFHGGLENFVIYQGDDWPRFANHKIIINACKWFCRC
jgi:hypothetical protein